MINQYPGKCYICGQPVGPREGYTVKHGNIWYVLHSGCKVRQ